MNQILLADDNPAVIEYIRDIVRGTPYEVHSYLNGSDAAEAFLHNEYDLVITDISMPGLNGFEFLERIRSTNTVIPVIMITGVGGIDEAVNAIKRGATDFVTKPFNPDEFRIKIEKSLQFYSLVRENERLRRNTGKGVSAIVGHSLPMKSMIQRISQVARSNAAIMVLGESGTGKELVARAVHAESARADRPFMAVDCSTLSETIIESELFGHTKGSFTGADRSRKGIFEEADGGTVFLDEIGNLTLQTQSKLLRFLQEREIKPVGQSRSIKVDVRIVSATNANLRESIDNRLFREDLYYRLSGIEIKVPPLRERKDDIPFLAGHFVRKYATTEMSARTIDEDALELLAKHEWKGNVRELEHLIEYALIIERTHSITADTVLRIIAPDSNASAISSSIEIQEEEMSPLDDAVARFETKYIMKALKATNNNRVKAAKLLDISRSVLYEKMHRYGIE